MNTKPEQKPEILKATPKRRPRINFPKRPNINNLIGDNDLAL